MNCYTYNIGQRFDSAAAEQSDRAALRFEDGTEVTYATLLDLSNRAATVLQDRGLKRRDVIAIVHTKTTFCYALMIAALKLGIAYVNVDDKNPPARLEHIFATSRPKELFAEELSEDVRTAAVTSGVPVSAVETLFDGSADVPSKDLRAAFNSVTGSDPAYIMYTSGSTGIPKGAVMTHAAVMNFGEWIRTRFDVTPDDVMSNLNPMYFDNSVFDFYGALLNGATLAPIRRDTLSNASLTIAAVETSRCTVWFSVPSLLIYVMSMKAFTGQSVPGIRAFVFGGEGYPKPELRKLHALYGARAKLINVYGPTECTCMCSAWNVREKDLADLDGFVTLGPIAENFSMLVLDGDRPVSAGNVGELCLLGPQVGLGYMNDPERSAKAFVQNPLNDAWSERMYRTGDLVRLADDGKMLDFVGRVDNQIKHMGYRIEPEEIEASLNRLKGVTRSAVLHRPTRRGVKLIVAYVAADVNVTEDELRRGLADLLPPYMIPQRFFVRKDLPKNANGKVDRVALSAEDFE